MKASKSLLNVFLPKKSYSILLSLSLFPLLLSCSAFKLDTSSNCLNPQAPCFKADVTPPQISQSVYPAANAIVSVLDHVDLLFSEELNNPQPSDFVFSGAISATVQSVQKINTYTYRLILNVSSLTSGTITLSFPTLKDYNNNTITGPTAVTYIGNVDIPVVLDSVDHYGISAGSGYATIDASWHYAYLPSVASNTIYTLRLTTGATDCDSGTPITPSAYSLAVGSAATSENVYTFSLDTAVITSIGAQVILICVDNSTYNKHGIGIINLVRDDSAPATALTPLAGPYSVPKALAFTCSDHADRIIFNLASTYGTGVAPLASAVTDPSFNTSTGAVISGTVYDSTNPVQTPYDSTQNPVYTIYKYRCIDQAGNIEAVETSGVYAIDNTFPTVTVASINKSSTMTAVSGVSSSGYQSIDVIWSTNQVNKNWEIRANGTACGSGGTVVTSGISGVNGTPSPANTPIMTTILYNSPGIAVGINTLLFCVNGSSVSIWGQDTRNLIRDETAPVLTINVPTGSYGAAQNLVYTCTDNADKVAYAMSTSVLGSSPAAPITPAFSSDGTITSGTPMTGSISVAAELVTTVNGKCIDVAGNQSALVSTAYTVDSVLPTVTVVSLDHSAVSGTGQPGDFASANLVWNTNVGGLAYKILENATDCSSGILESSGTSVANTNVTTNLSYSDFASNGTTYPLLICVFNYANNPGYQTTALQIMRDDTPPSFGGLTTISAVNSSSFTLNWPAATDTGGSGVAFYNIYQSTTSGGPYTTANYMVAAPATSFNVSGLDSATVYYFIAGAVDSAGNLTQVTATELTSKPTTTLAVAGLGAGNTFNLTDGASSMTVSANTAGTPWTTTLVTGQTYNFSFTAQPSGQVCALQESQFGVFDTSRTLHVNCATGNIATGNFLQLPPAPLRYFLFQGKVSSLGLSGLISPDHLSSDGSNLYIGDVGNLAIRKVNLATNALTTLVTATGVCTSAVLTTVGFISPMAMANDGTNLYIGDHVAHVIFRIPLTGGTLTQIAGTGAGCTLGSGASTDSTNPLQATFNGIDGVAFYNGYLYIAEYYGQNIRRMNLVTGEVSTVLAGTRAADIVVAGKYLYFANTTNNKILRLDLTTNLLDASFAVGSGVQGFQDGALTSAQFNSPLGLVTDGTNLFVSEYAASGSTGARRIRKVDLLRNLVTTLAGPAYEITSEPGSVTLGTGASVLFRRPRGMATDGRNLYVADTDANQVFKIVDNGLVGYWPLDGNANDYASDVTTSQNATLFNAPTQTNIDRFGNASTAYGFNGSSQYISAPGTNLPTGNNPRSVCAWVKILDSTNAGNNGVMTYGQRGANTVFGLRMADATDFSSWSASVDVGFNAPLTISNWAHTCVTHDGTNTRVYQNGHLANQLATSYSTNSGNLCIGVRSNTSGTSACDGGFYFTGAISDVRVYARVLDEGEINELAQDAIAAQVGDSFNNGATGLLSQYSFDGGTAGAINPAASGPVGGTLGGSASSPTGKDGDAYGSAYFSGASLTASPTGLPTYSAPRSECAWVSLAAQPGYSPARYPIISYGTATTYHDLVYYNQSTSGANAYTLAMTLNGTTVAPATAQLPLNTWQHLCFTYDGATTTLYQNGTQLFSQTGTLSGPTNPTIMKLGGRSSDSTNFFNGNIDDVRIYNNALSAAQIRQLATQVPAGLVAHYDFTGDANDVSGWANNLSNNGASATPDRFGQTIAAYAFSSASSSLLVQNAPVSALNSNFSIAAWVLINSLPVGGATIIENGLASNNGYALTIDSSGELLIAALGVGGYSVIKLQQSVWTHIAATYTTAGSWIVYINGSAVTVTGSAPNVPTSYFSIGAFGSGSSYFDGSIDDVRVYNRVLAQSEVQALVQQSNKRIFVTASTYTGDLRTGGVGTGIAGADNKCNADTNKPTTGTYKALITDSGASLLRRACTTNNCSTGGVTEHIDWVLRPNITYLRTDGITTIFTANWNAVFDFGAGSFANAITTTALFPWTGLGFATGAQWVIDGGPGQCDSWTNINISNGVYGNSSLTTQGTSPILGTMYDGFDTGNCNTLQNLYCVEQ